MNEPPQGPPEPANAESPAQRATGAEAGSSGDGAAECLGVGAEIEALQRQATRLHEAIEELFEHTEGIPEGDQRTIERAFDHVARTIGGLRVSEAVSSQRQESWAAAHAVSERALLGSERRFTTVFQNAPIGISLTTVHGAKILNVNERYCQLVGYPREALLGRSTVELGILDPAVRSRLMDAALGGNRAPQEVRLRAASGELCEALVAVEIQDLDGEACALSMYLDLSARRRLEREVLEVAAREQRRLAQDLHDGLGSHLTGVAMLARGLARAARRGEAVAPEQIEEIAGLVQEGIEQARALARGLDPVQIEGEGLAPALHRLAAETGRRAQTACTLELSEPLPDLRGAAAVHLYRIAQEALTNAARHARADHLAVRLGVEGNLLRLEVEDDGRGIPEACTKGMGLQTMRYRANLIGATLDVASAPGRGTRVTCRLPLADLDPPSEA